MQPLWQVALCSPPYTTLTYGEPEWFGGISTFAPGMRVLVPLGKSRAMRAGVIIGRPGNGDRIPDPSKTRPIFWPLERDPMLDRDYLDMVMQLAIRHSIEPGTILGSVLPAGLRTSQLRFVVHGDGAPKKFKPAEMKNMDSRELRGLAETWTGGSMAAVVRSGDAPREFCSVIKDPPWAVRPSAKRQIELLEYLWDHGPVARDLLTKKLGASVTRPLATLAEAGIVSIAPMDEEEIPDEVADACAATCEPGIEDGIPSRRDFRFSDEQEAALAPLREALLEGKGGEHLLFGVTGSGKTAVYLELARLCLEQGRSAMLLAPEVALACALHRAVTEAFPEVTVRFYHGYQPPARRERTFRETGEESGPQLVVGTRSALFLPLHGIGLIVLDEEHDSSFKQDEGLNYQAKEVGYFRARQDNGILVLGSATPDLKTYYSGLSGHFPVLAMKNRVGQGTLPSVNLVDIRDLRTTEQVLAPESETALKSALEAGDQAIIMLNRRGYSPLMYCVGCEEVASCPNCEIGLTYHKGRERLVCHYCGYSTPFPYVCGSCGGSQFHPLGEGTERIEETLSASLPPGTGVLRLDRDSTRRQGRMEEILADFAAGKAQVLVGTQMLSKGHHFPNVTQVIVADGDLGLNLPDYRAAERTFQLLVQVAGRAGRGEKPGTVHIQTRDPNHFCWRYVMENDYEGFYEAEIARRKKRRYPPFAKLALIRMSYPMDWDQGLERVNATASVLRRMGRELGVTALGPAPAPLALLRGRRRYHCLLKGDSWPSIRTLYAKVLADIPSSMLASGKIRISLDIDPVNML